MLHPAASHACLALLALGSCSRGGLRETPATLQVASASPTPTIAEAAPRAVLEAAAPPPVANCSGGREDGPAKGVGCWFAGTSCDGHGVAQEPELHGTIVKTGSTHGGCNIATYTLVYEPGTSPLRVRVCAAAPPPEDCPAMALDYATWDIAPLLAESGTTRATLVGARKRTP